MHSYRPKICWGSSLWAFIHTITIIDNDDSNIRNSEINEVIRILKNIEHIIPCKKCAKHYHEFIEIELNQNIYENMQLFKIMFEYHNKINEKLSKKKIIYEDALHLWSKFV
jgi:hypothetical protein